MDRMDILLATVARFINGYPRRIDDVPSVARREHVPMHEEDDQTTGNEMEVRTVHFAGNIYGVDR